MPAAAVIPAPVAYAKVVAVKKLVAEVWRVSRRVRRDGVYQRLPASFRYVPLAGTIFCLRGGASLFLPREAPDLSL